MTTINQIPNRNLDIKSVINDIKIVTTNGFEHWTASDVAAEYAINALVNAGHEFTSENALNHLKRLADNGGVFDMNEAIETTLNSSRFSW